jgi:hypothetical protein
MLCLYLGLTGRHSIPGCIPKYTGDIPNLKTAILIRDHLELKFF